MGLAHVESKGLEEEGTQLGYQWISQRSSRKAVLHSQECRMDERILALWAQSRELALRNGGLPWNLSATNPNRTIPAMRDLEQMSDQSEQQEEFPLSYSPPKRKIHMRPILSFLFIWSFLIMGYGIARTAMSVITSVIANHSALHSELGQGSPPFEVELHRKVSVKRKMMPHAAVRTMRILLMRRKVGVVKIRR